MKMIISLLLLVLSSPVHAGELQDSLAAFFASKPSVKGVSAELIRVNQWPEIKGKVRWSLPKRRFFSTRTSLVAEQGKGKSLRRWYVSANIRWMKSVVTLKHDISARTVLDKSMLTIKRKNIADLHGHVWADKNDVIGLKSLRNMQRGDIIVSNIVKRPPLIKRGDRVTILAEAHGIQVRAEGIALKSGSRGDRMLVQNIRSKQTLQSTVEDAHTVYVNTGGV